MEQDPDGRTREAIERDHSRLRDFVRRRVPDPGDAEDVLQDVYAELVEANRLLMPVEHVTAWLFRVARNRITDLFRRRKPERLGETDGDSGERLGLEQLLPSTGDGPEALFLRGELLDELEQAIDDLPEEQREVFVAHELEGRSFKELAAESGVKLNTLLSRKRYAVLALRERLREVYEAYREWRGGST